MALTSQAQAMAIWKLNNIVYSRLSNPRSSVISDQWKHDTTQDWENLAKNLDGVSAELIEDEALLRLDMHISATGYLEEGAPRFTEVTGDEEMIEDGGEAETVSNSEEENKKKGLYVKRRETRRLYHLQLLIRLHLRLLCLYLGLLLRLHLRLHLRLRLLYLCLSHLLFCCSLFRLCLMWLCLCLGRPLFCCLLFRLRLVCLCLCLGYPLFCHLLFCLRLVCLCLCLGRRLLRLYRLCLVCLYLCLGRRLLCLCLVYLCLCLGCLFRRFLYDLICKHQHLFWEDKD